jgi:pyrimidine operon attenuation protein/uracil phosphoribosyltransferase
MTSTTETRVLDQITTKNILIRLAWEILEQHFDKARIHLLAIHGNGEKFAHLLANELIKINAPTIHIHTIVMDKARASTSAVTVEPPLETLENAGVLLLDDVLNTGKTLMYSVVPLLKLEPESLEIAVLVDRGHHLYPLEANYTGYRLATTLQEHIRVSFEEGDFGVYLS